MEKETPFLSVSRTCAVRSALHFAFFHLMLRDLSITTYKIYLILNNCLAFHCPCALIISLISLLLVNL